MAASNFVNYQSFKKHLGANSGPDLDTDVFRAGLFKTGVSDFTLSVLASLGSDATGGGYATKTLSNTSWLSVNASTYRFDADDVFFSATGSNIIGIKYCVVWASGAPNELVGYTRLSTAAFTLTGGNRLTVQLNASGLFNLGGGTTL